MLADEVADLISDVEYDLRDRTRKIVRIAEEFFDVADPAQDVGRVRGLAAGQRSPRPRR